MSEPGERPKRRKRYSGKHPRRFEEKYKEHEPERFPETVAKVIAAGKTPAGAHVPILMDECLEALHLRPGLTGVDATLGFGGHARRILEAISPGGRLIGLDVDPVERPKTAERLAAAGFANFEAVASNYAGIRKVLDARGLATVDFVFADLGCSSMQFDDPARGFSFKAEGPLDMRMNPERGIPARDWLLRAKPEKLAAALVEHADEPHAERLAEVLAGRDFPLTTDLAAAVAEILTDVPRADPELSVRRVFQAIRIAVNEEFSALEAFLRVLPDCLAPGGRVAVMTFHSGEDRRVKHAFRNGANAGIYRETSQGVVTAGPEERRLNPRSTPAKLRWAERGG